MFWHDLLLIGLVIFFGLTFLTDYVIGCAVQTGVLVIYTTPSPKVTYTGTGGNCFAGVPPPHTSCQNNNAQRFVKFGTISSSSIVSMHNVVRAGVTPKAKDMGLLSWDPLMAYLAARWASQCGNFSERVTNRAVPGKWDYVGQNVYQVSGTANVDFNVAFNAWGNEKTTGPFNYGDTTLTYARVGRYTQIIWAKTQVVGCAAAVCTNPTSVYYVCDYAPSGNLAVNGRHPFAYPYTSTGLSF